MNRLFIFLWERFPPVAYLPLIAGLYGAASVRAARAVAGVDGGGVGAWGEGGAGGLGAWRGVVGGVALALVFLHLRLFDELKDFDHDRRFNPGRPLPRGLVTVGEVRVGWIVVLLAELGLAAWLGVQALVAMALVQGYSVVMLNEFWIRDWLRPRLLTYAVTHTLITPLMLLFVMAVETGRLVWAPPAGYLGFALAGWPLFLVFEVARKTFTPERERIDVPSYSSVHGAGRAAALTVLFGGAAVGLASVGAASSAAPLLGALAVLMVACAPYALGPTVARAKLLRAGATAFLLLFCVGVVVG